MTLPAAARRSGTVLCLAVVCLVSAGAPAAAESAAPAAGCPAARGGTRIAELLAGRRFVEAHLLAELITTICPDESDAPRWRIFDAVALLRLDEPEPARELLAQVAESHGEHAGRARIVLAWSYLRSHDRQAYQETLSAVPAPARLRLDALDAAGDRGRFRRAASALDAALRTDALAAHDRLLRARCKRPWLAGLLSAVLPGAGQVYAGSWQGAAVSFLLNGVLVGATVELARNELYFSAAATGLAASIFYVGNILNAADLADRQNDLAALPARDALERLLVPEVP